MMSAGRHDEAIAAFERALQREPDSAAALLDLGNALAQSGRTDEALACYDSAVTLDAASPAPHKSKGDLLFAMGRYPEALGAFHNAIRLRPDQAVLHYNRGATRWAMDQREDALIDFDQALSLRPEYAEAHHAKGHVLAGLRRFEESAVSYAAAVAHKPDLPFAVGDAVMAQAQLCDWKDLERGIDAMLAGIRRGQLTSVPFELISLTDAPEEQLAGARLLVRARHPDTPLQPHARGRRKPRRQIAYVSGNYYEHAVAYLIAELLERHDRGRFEVTAISLGPVGTGAMRSRIEAAVERFVDVRGTTDRAVAELMRDLEVDIAVDLMGHTAGGRPGIFAYRGAPVQVNYLGYPGTMGAAFIDYIIADPFLVPGGWERFYSEQVVRLPDCYQPNDTKRRIGSGSATRAELGLPAEGFVFCSFNNSFKINPPMFEVWMRLLREVEGSVLWLLETSGVVKGNLRREAQARGVSGERLIFAPRFSLEAHLSRHRAADLFLDTLPYNAHTTASDALWAGLPVVTCAGRSFAARVAGSLLHGVGLAELVTTSLAEYEALALGLAREPGRLGALRARLARNRETAPLFDIERYRRHLESAYEAMWARHVAGEPPRAFDVAPIAGSTSSARR